eukprot:5736130-Amphidinium_carterae.1
MRGSHFTPARNGCHDMHAWVAHGMSDIVRVSGGGGLGRSFAGAALVRSLLGLSVTLDWAGALRQARWCRTGDGSNWGLMTCNGSHWQPACKQIDLTALDDSLHC